MHQQVGKGVGSSAAAGLAEAVSGRSSVVSVAEILGLLSSMRKTGTLWVETACESFLVQLEDGAVVYAQGDLPREGELLGQVLVDQGALLEEVLEAALASAARERTVLGAFLVKHDLISPGCLARALARQAQGIFDRMFGTGESSWRFERDVRMVESEDMRLNVIQLLLESARASDEHRRHLEAGVGLPIARAAAGV